ncbi:unnamed protein product [Acanthoscelides obtectus]|uniref:Uncharacterized protein n=1 Tax=Acanthoscelides obtectus TaxID=200917 RepID=A0A9P0JLK3_ACAOB|nr:unnamed protein product [Acanthoscelides obtectus]CAK1672988.1 hypothetical protein AOBTE_LOCUS29174 [Acanthoscelides obtectus]
MRGRKKRFSSSIFDLPEQIYIERTWVQSATTPQYDIRRVSFRIPLRQAALCNRKLESSQAKLMLRQQPFRKHCCSQLQTMNNILMNP